ncbi:MAG: hypothetical protein MRY21_06115 [Simkaniaceae bacterium]|nr:hypothetical protein [Simkaniaceae bacterium]
MEVSSIQTAGAGAGVSASGLRATLQPNVDKVTKLKEQISNLKGSMHGRCLKKRRVLVRLQRELAKLIPTPNTTSQPSQVISIFVPAATQGLYAYCSKYHTPEGQAIRVNLIRLASVQIEKNEQGKLSVGDQIELMKFMQDEEHGFSISFPGLAKRMTESLSDEALYHLVNENGYLPSVDSVYDLGGEELMRKAIETINYPPDLAGTTEGKLAYQVSLKLVENFLTREVRHTSFSSLKEEALEVGLNCFEPKFLYSYYNKLLPRERKAFIDCCFKSPDLPTSRTWSLFESVPAKYMFFLKFEIERMQSENLTDFGEPPFESTDGVIQFLRSQRS